MFGNRFEIEEVFQVFHLFEQPRKKLKNVPLAASLRAPFYVIKSFACGLLAMVKNPFGTKNTST